MADDTTNTGAPVDSAAAPTTTADTTATTSTTSPPATEGQPAAASAPAPEATSTTTEATAPESKPVAPETYDLKLPEGSLLSAEAVQEVEALAREAGLSNEHAQKLLDAVLKKEAMREPPPEKYDLSIEDGSLLDADDLQFVEQRARELRLSQKEAEQLRDSTDKAFHEWRERKVQAWNQRIEQDPSIGGQKLETTKRLIDKFAAKFGDAELREDARRYGFGSNPPLARALVKMMGAISEDVFEPAGGQSAGTKQGGAGWYNHPTSQHAA